MQGGRNIITDEDKVPVSGRRESHSKIDPHSNPSPWLNSHSKSTKCNICKPSFCTVNCLDQHVRKSPESVALIWERDEPGTEVRITYRYCVPSNVQGAREAPSPVLCTEWLSGRGCVSLKECILASQMLSYPGKVNMNASRMKHSKSRSSLPGHTLSAL